VLLHDVAVCMHTWLLCMVNVLTWFMLQCCICFFALQPEDPSVKRASRHSPAIITPTAVIAAPVAQMTGNGFSAAPLSPGGSTYMAMSGSLPVGIAGMVPSPVPLRPTSFSPVTNLRDNPPCNTLLLATWGTIPASKSCGRCSAVNQGNRYGYLLTVWKVVVLLAVCFSISSACQGRG